MIIQVDQIIFDKISGCAFHFKNSVGKIFGVRKEVKLLLHDKETDVDAILLFFKSTHRTIVEAEFPDNDDYHPHYINFMALE